MANMYDQTPVLLASGATPNVSERTHALKESLNSLGYYETEREVRNRWGVFFALEYLFKYWIREESLQNGMSEADADAVGGNLAPCGLLKIGVFPIRADIEALCLAPRHIERDQFYRSFLTFMKEQPHVADVRVFAYGAFIPVLKMRFYGSTVNLSFATLDLATVPESLDLQDDMLLNNLQPECIRSLNGYRATDQIIQLVPDIEIFRVTLGAIRLWAERRHIFSNKLGYLNDMSLAILVAYTCQQYPNALPAMLLNKFFSTFLQWEWPRPVLLSNPNSADSVDLTRFTGLMPILAPTDPLYNANHNINESNMIIVLEEILRALKITDAVFEFRCEWNHLFEKPDFFLEYEHYFVIQVTCSRPEDQMQCSDFIMTKIRGLVDDLEYSPHTFITHLDGKTYHKGRYYTCGRLAHVVMSTWVIGLNIESNVEDDFTKLDFESYVRTFADEVNGPQAAHLPNKLVEVKFVDLEDMPRYLSSSTLYGAGLMEWRHRPTDPSPRRLSESTVVALRPTGEFDPPFVIEIRRTKGGSKRKCRGGHDPPLG